MGWPDYVDARGQNAGVVGYVRASWRRMIGGPVGPRPASLNPAARNADTFPVQANASGIDGFRGWTGSLHHQRAVRSGVAGGGPQKLHADPLCRRSLRTNKQVTDHGEASSSSGSARDRASPGKWSRGATEHHPIGRFSSYNRTPGTWRPSTISRNTARLPSALAALNGIAALDDEPRSGRPPELLPLMPGLAARRTHDCKRNRTTTLFAALEIATGRITADACYPRHRHQEFLRFLMKAAAARPAADLHVVLDNDNTHKHAEVRRRLARPENQRITLHFTPTGCSWLNMVEIFFGIITR